MNTWLEMKRKHGGELPAVLAARDELRRRLEVQGDLAGALERLDRQIAEAARAVKKEAHALRTVREKAAKELAKAAAKGIAQLGFKKADFQIRIVPLSEPGPTGDCGCEFLFSPNVGEPPLPLNRIASSGELARVMLALKTVLADLDGVPLLVFDEVDANVGGEIGRVVGEKMAAIAKNHQVLCVTHLPQVAAQPPGGDEGPVEGPRHRGDRADPGEPQGPRERARPHARRPQRKERAGPRRGITGKVARSH
jgi:DNA repair protein RecN (Recombination protein N)